MAFSATALASRQRAQRLVDAARDLTNESGDAAFTVAQVAARAGASLKGFYSCFASKDDLLLAVLAEDTRAGATLLTAMVDRYRRPDRRLRAYVDGLFELAALGRGYSAILVREERRLGTDHPAELEVALAPLVDLLATEIKRAVDVRPVDRMAEIAFETLVGGLAEVLLAHRDAAEVAEERWRFVTGGLGITREGP
jgi:AcrR family transcriptional regulator